MVVGAAKNSYWLPLPRLLAAVNIADCRFYKFVQKMGERSLDARVNFRHFDNYYIGYARELNVTSFRDTESCRKIFDEVETMGDISPGYSLAISIVYVMIKYDKGVFKLRLLNEKQREYFEQICRVLSINRRRLISMLNFYLPKITKSKDLFENI